MNLPEEKVLNNLKRIGNILLNIWLFVVFGGLALARVQKAGQAGSLDFVEISFAVQNAVMIFMILLRKDHKAIDGNIFHQIIAMIAVFSGLAFVDIPADQSSPFFQISKIIVFVANVMGMITLFNLGRSFGFLIAIREVRSGGLYSVIRHPMYFTDILLRIGYIAGNMNSGNLFFFVFSTACYVYRAVLEERFLSQTQEYRDFMDQVKYRFIPYIY